MTAYKLAPTGDGSYRLVPQSPLCHLCGEGVEPPDLEEFDGIGEVYVQGSFLHWECDECPGHPDEPGFSETMGETSCCDGSCQQPSPILAIHRACGESDNAARSEAAYFAGGQA